MCSAGSMVQQAVIGWWLKDVTVTTYWRPVGRNPSCTYRARSRRQLNIMILSMYGPLSCTSSQCSSVCKTVTSLGRTADYMDCCNQHLSQLVSCHFWCAYQHSIAVVECNKLIITITIIVNSSHRCSLCTAVCQLCSRYIEW